MYGIESDTDEFSERWAPYAVALLRIVVALLIIEHGTAKILGVPASPMAHPAMWSALWISGWVQLIGGLALLAGFMTRIVGLVLAAAAAIGYVLNYAPGSFYPVLNHGEATLLFCFVTLLLGVVGAGEWSVDKVLARNRSDVEGYAAPGGERSSGD